MDGYILYAHINKTNGKKYIGITCQSADRRWRDGNGYKSNNHFYSAIKKYGWENFEHIVLKNELTKEDAEKLEAKLIEKYNTTNRKIGYNTKEGGGSNGRHTKETRKKMSQLCKQRPVDWQKIRKMQELNTGAKRNHEIGKKISQKKIGKKLTQEHIKNISESHKGHVHTEEQKKKIGESVKRAFSSPEMRKKLSKSGKQNQKSIAALKRLAIERIQINKKVILTNTGDIFENHLTAGKKLNIQPHKILKNCQRETHSAGKDSNKMPMIWCFLHEYDNNIDYQTAYKEKMTAIKTNATNARWRHKNSNTPI